MSDTYPISVGGLDLLCAGAPCEKLQDVGLIDQGGYFGRRAFLGGKTPPEHVAQPLVRYCPFSRHDVAYLGTNRGKTVHGIFHGIPRNLPRTCTTYDGTLILTLTP